MKEFISAIKPLFPVTFSLNKFVNLKFENNQALYTMLIQIAIYLAVGVVVGIVLGILGAIVSFLGLVWGLIGTLVSLYLLAGIVLSVLDYCKVFDDKE